MCENMLAFQNRNQDKFFVLSICHLISRLKNIKYVLHVMYFVLAPNSSSTVPKMQ